MYNAAVAKSPGKAFNYFRTLKTIPVWHLTLGRVRNTHTLGVSLKKSPFKGKPIF